MPKVDLYSFDDALKDALKEALRHHYGVEADGEVMALAAERINAMTPGQRLASFLGYPLDDAEAVAMCDREWAAWEASRKKASEAALLVGWLGLSKISDDVCKAIAQVIKGKGQPEAVLLSPEDHNALRTTWKQNSIAFNESKDGLLEARICDRRIQIRAAERIPRDEIHVITVASVTCTFPGWNGVVDLK